MTRDEFQAQLAETVNQVLQNEENENFGAPVGFLVLVLREGGVILRGGGCPDPAVRSCLGRYIRALALQMSDGEWTDYFRDLSE